MYSNCLKNAVTAFCKQSINIWNAEMNTKSQNLQEKSQDNGLTASENVE